MSATAIAGPGADMTRTQQRAMTSLVPLLFIFVFGILCLQAFNLVFATVGADVGAPERAALITAIPGVVLGIVCVIYGSLGDFVSLKKMMMAGIALIVVGSLLGILLSSSIWAIIIARAIQTAGSQVAGSVFLVVTTKYVPGPRKVFWFGVFTACYQLSTAIGVLAGGWLTEIDWRWLFVIPLLSVLFAPVLWRNLPDLTGEGSHIDVAGFLLAGITIAALVLFFNGGNWVYLIGFVVLAIAFGVYISKARAPFVTPEFFANAPYLMSIFIIVLFYFGNYAMTPLFNNVGGEFFGKTPGQMSFVLLAGYLAGFAMGMSSGAIVGRIGRGPGILIAGSLLTAGALIAAFAAHQSVWGIGIAAVVFFAGLGLCYSPVVDTVMGTVDVSESGRAVGMNDLMMNVSPSIAIALIGPWMGSAPFTGLGAPGVPEGLASNYSTLFLLVAASAVLGIVWFLLVRPKLYTDGWGRTTDAETETGPAAESAAAEGSA